MMSLKNKHVLSVVSTSHRLNLSIVSYCLIWDIAVNAALLVNRWTLYPQLISSHLVSYIDFQHICTPYLSPTLYLTHVLHLVDNLNNLVVV